MDAPLPAHRRGGRIVAAVALAWVWAAAPTRAEPLVHELADRAPAAEQALRRGGLPADAAAPLSVVLPSGLPAEEAPDEVAEVGPLDEARALALVMLIPSGLYFVEKGTTNNVVTPGPTDVTVLDTTVTDTPITDTHHMHQTPEPASLALGLFGLALGGAAAWRRRRRRPAPQPA
jgi:hypothetical protein